MIIREVTPSIACRGRFFRSNDQFRFIETSLRSVIFETEAEPHAASDNFEICTIIDISAPTAKQGSEPAEVGSIPTGGFLCRLSLSEKTAGPTKMVPCCFLILL